MNLTIADMMSSSTFLRMPTPYQNVVDQLDLAAALTNGSERNDLLLPRAEDKVGGEVGNRFLQALIRDLERGRYDPAPAYTVRVPKSTSATRPAALLTLNDRVVYAALVATLRSRIDSYLLGEEIVFWPRGLQRNKSWLKFEHSPLTDSCKYVVLADVSGFYESVDHRRLAERLIRATGKRAEVEALSHFLTRVMGGSRGLPQGLDASDPLATAYLAELDFAMIRNGFAYTRHGDDFRVAMKGYDDARGALYTLEACVRSAGLLLSGHKTRVLKASTYKDAVQSMKKSIADVRSKVLSNKLATLEDDPDALEKAIDLADMEQLGWDFFYHGNVSLQEVIDQLRPSLEPNAVEIAEDLFAETWERRPGKPNALASDAFHQRIVASLVRLAAGRSPKALGAAGDILTSYPEKSEVVCSYLLALAGTEPKKVAAQASKTLKAGRFRTEWEVAWAARVLTSVADQLPEWVVSQLEALTTSPFDSWLAATEVAKLLSAQGELSREAFMRLWNACPVVFRADLVVAANSLSTNAEWARVFLSAVKDDRIHQVILGQLQQQGTQPATS